jgi:DNA-binding NarL/FixJ family response regulator
VIPLVVIEGDDMALRAARTRLTRAGWLIVEGWETPEPSPGDRLVRAGVVSSEADAVMAVLAALSGSGVLVDSRADRDLADRLCDDLRRLGPVEHVVGTRMSGPLSQEQVAMVQQLLAGATLGQAARRLHLSRRTADRRMAGVRHALRASTTAEALLLARRLGLG